MNDQWVKLDPLSVLGPIKRSNGSDLALGAQRIQNFEKIGLLSRNMIYTVAIENASNAACFSNFYEFMADQDLKLYSIAVFGLLGSLNGLDPENGTHKVQKCRSNGFEFFSQFS